MVNHLGHFVASNQANLRFRAINVDSAELEFLLQVSIEDKTMKMASTTFLTIVALSVACLVAPSYGQSQTATINCYQCHGLATGISQPSTDGPGCSYPFNATGLKTVQCQGQCVTTITFDASSRKCTLYLVTKSRKPIAIINTNKNAHH